jgi:hypothetical protein
MTRGLIFGCCLFAACGGSAGSAEVSGTIEGTPFNEVETVFHGNSHILLFDRKMDCLDTAWVANNYVDGEDPTEGDHDFIALQFTFESDTPTQGTFSVAPDAPVKGLALLNDDATNGGVFTFHRGRGGFMTITAMESDTVTGTFEIQFSSDGVTGDFEAAYCRNLR